MPGCPSHMCSFNRGNVEENNFENLCLMFVYVCFALCLCRAWFRGLQVS